MINQCECGCGEEISLLRVDGKSKRFQYGHSLRVNEQKGDKNPNWNGGQTITKLGYSMTLAPNHPFVNKMRYVMTHRLIMEKHLGRYLDPKEVVHHIDGNKLNNDISNLELLTSQNHHCQIHSTIDMSNRTCSICNSKEISIDKNSGYKHWRYYKNKLICHKCYTHTPERMKYMKNYMINKRAKLKSK